VKCEIQTERVDAWFKRFMIPTMYTSDNQ